MSLFAKDPSAILDYSFDWANWLTAGEEITNTRWSVTPVGELTLGNETAADSVRGVFLSGGVEGHRYRLNCQIETDAGRTAERSTAIRVMEV